MDILLNWIQPNSNFWIIFWIEFSHQGSPPSTRGGRCTPPAGTGKSWPWARGRRKRKHSPSYIQAALDSSLSGESCTSSLSLSALCFVNLTSFAHSCLCLTSGNTKAVLAINNVESCLAFSCWIELSGKKLWNIPEKWYWIIFWIEFYLEINEWIVFWIDICFFFG